MDTTTFMNDLIKQNQNATIIDSNFRFVQDANKNGLDLEKMAKENVEMKKSLAEVDSMKKEIEELRRKVNLNDDIELKAFEAMEAEVKSDADVKLAKDILAKEKTKAITALCMQYPGFASAYADYKSKVYEAHQKMQKGE